MMKDKMNNVINIFGEDETKKSILRTIEHAKQDTEDFNIVNCMIIMIDDQDTITYSYSNFNRSVTMVGALETLKHVFIRRDNEDW